MVMPGSGRRSGQRPRLDLRLGRRPPQRAQGAGMRDGHGAVAGEGARVAAGELARVQGYRHDLARRDTHLDPATDEARIEGVVAGIESERTGQAPPG